MENREHTWHDKVSPLPALLLLLLTLHVHYQADSRERLLDLAEERPEMLVPLLPSSHHPPRRS